MIKARPFKMEDLSKMEHKNRYANLYQDMLKQYCNVTSHMLTLYRGEEVICVAGVSSRREGVGELWILPGKLIDKYKCEFFKAIYRLIYGYVFQDLNFYRLEMAILDKWEKGIKWAKKLGFEAEGVMKAYDTHGRDHILFAKVRG